MALLLSSAEVAGLVSLSDAIEVIEAVAREEVAGTTVHMAPFGGAHARPRGLPPARSSSPGARSGGVLRAVGGGAFGLGRIGIRAGGVSLVFDTDGQALLAIVGSGFSNLRLAASVALAACHLAPPEGRSVGLLGSGRLALPLLEGLCSVRPIERVAVYSPTPEHREAFARRATTALGVPTMAVDRAEEAVGGADIVAVATSSPKPVVTADQIASVAHVVSVGEPHELDASIYVRASKIVASSRQLELELINPSGQHAAQRRGLDPVPLWQLLEQGRLTEEDIVELGEVIAGEDAEPGGSGITVFLESQGGAGDIALANLAYKRAEALGRGFEFQF